MNSRKILFLAFLISICGQHSFAQTLRCEQVLLSKTNLEKTTQNLSLQKDSQDSSSVLSSILDFFRGSENDRLIKAESQAQKIQEQGTVFEKRLAFERYAKLSGISYQRVDKRYVIEPDEKGSKLNQFAATVAEKLVLSRERNIELAFNPFSTNLGTFDIKNLRIEISLASILRGRPTEIEAHEIRHLFYKTEVTKRRPVLLRARIVPYRLATVRGKKNFAYQSGFSLEELSAFGRNLRLDHTKLKKTPRLSGSSKKILMQSLKAWVKNIEQIFSVVQANLAEVSKLSPEVLQKLLEFKIIPDTSGEPEVRVFFPYVDGLFFFWKSQQLVEAVQKLTSPESPASKVEALNLLTARFVLQIESLKELSSQLEDPVQTLIKIEENPQFIYSDQFSEAIRQYQLFIATVEEKFKTDFVISD